MKAVFVSNYINHHQIPFCDAIYRRLGEQLAGSAGYTGEEESVSPDCPQPDSRLLGPAGSF